MATPAPATTGAKVAKAVIALLTAIAKVPPTTSNPPIAPVRPTMAVPASRTG